MPKKINILSSRNIDDKTTEEYFNLLKNNPDKIECFYCPFCMNKVLIIEGPKPKGSLIFSTVEKKTGPEFSRICERCNNFMAHAYEVDYSGLNSFLNGRVTN